jgi:hypothetical protein
LNHAAIPGLLAALCSEFGWPSQAHGAGDAFVLQPENQTQSIVNQGEYLHLFALAPK